MIGTIRKHQQWLWAFLIAAVIVSFVIYFTPTVGRGGRGGGRREAFGTMNGRPIPRQQYVEAWLEVQLDFFMNYYTWPERAELKKFRFSLERETANRLVLLEKLRELDVQVDEGAMAEWIVAHFSDAKTPGSAKTTYQWFVQQELPRHNVSAADFRRFIEHQIGIEHLVAVASIPGKLVTPREAAELYRQENEKVEAQAVVFSATNFQSSVKLEPAALAQFYTNRQSFYRIPERVQVSYVKFPATNYLVQADQALAKITNLAAEIDQRYRSSGPGFFTDTNGQVMPEEAAKARIKQDLRDRQALFAAHKEAALFATDLEKIQPVKAENLKNLAAAKGLVCLDLEPFDEEGPRGLKAGAAFAQAAFKLTPDRPFSPPTRAEDAIYLIALKQKLASEVPALETIRAQVTDDYLREQARQLARQAGSGFHGLVTNRLAQGGTFAEACAALKVTPINLPRFSANTRNLPDLDRRLDLSLVKTTAAALPAGKTSELVNTYDGGFVLHVKSRTPVAEADLKKELPQFLADLRQAQRLRSFYEWFGKQKELCRIDTLTGKEEEE
jgi:hypothetical protein